MKAVRLNKSEVPGRMPMTDRERNELWRDYAATRELFLRNALVVEYMPVVRFVAETICTRFPYSIILDDLISSGTIGLIKAIEAFDLSRGVKFETFCLSRVRGAIIDSLRSQDWVPRVIRRRLSKCRQAQHSLEAELGRHPTQEELAEYLGLNVQELGRLMNEVTSVTIFNLADSTDVPDAGFGVNDLNCIEDGDSPDPLEVLKKGEIMDFARRHLSELEFTVIDSYYNGEMSMSEIGSRLGTSESRASQIHIKALRRLRELLVRKGTDGAEL